MSYGLRAYNNANQVLVSSDLQNFHFAGTATYQGNASAPSGMAYPITLSSSNSYYQGSGGHHEHRIVTYKAPYAGTAHPLVFIKPSSDSYSQESVAIAILTHRYVSGYWYFDVIINKVSGFTPTLYVFTSPNNLSITGDYGLQVFLDDATPAFDSRKRPLAILGGNTIKPPNIPMNDGAPSTSVYENSMGWHGCNLSGYESEVNWDFNCDNSNRWTSHNLSSNVTSTGSGSDIYYKDVMFASPSVAQASYRIRRHHYHCDGCNSWSQANEHHTANLEYAVFYRSTFRIDQPATGATLYKFSAGWVPLAYRFAVTARQDSWAPWNGECSGSQTVGFPFNAATINNNISNMYILADASRYA